MDEQQREKKNTIAQWAFDTRPILGRFHLWLEDVDVRWSRGEPAAEFTREISFLPGQMERLFAMMGAVTALGTRLFGRFGEGAGLPKAGLNQVKKDADAISAYAMSECLWYLSRHLPENHAIMVSLGEGLMPKAGETPEMGSNPQLGFGRVYARPEVARKLDRWVVRLLNDPSYGWDAFYTDVKGSNITVWGAAIDTLENTSRFAKGNESGALTVIHLFDQPLKISRPYEGYVGNLILPAEIVHRAAERSVLVNFRTPRALVMEMIRLCYPDIEPERMHVWCLRGKSREGRIGGLWQEWEATGAHVVDDGWILPSGIAAFSESGTYAPTYRIGTWVDDAGQRHLFLVDGYAASAEAMQAASLAPMLGLEASLCVFTSTFKLPYDREAQVMRLDPEAADFAGALHEVMGSPPDAATVAAYQAMIREARDAGLDLVRPTIVADDFFPEKRWDVLAVLGHMCPDPYSGADGVEQVGDHSWAVTVRLATPRGDKRIRFVLRLMKDHEESRLVFNPLLIRFFSGEDYENRAVKISDSGRIRNELQTLCLEALEFIGSDRIRVHFDHILPEVIRVEHQRVLLDVLTWYKANHPRWFAWLEIAPPSSSSVSG
ncbi:MAG: hypothetical protein ABIO70_26400 [Pseudomonadota bacterium]